jgi:hypothetical protein
MASAAPTSVFFGSHPRKAQVPPNGLESTIATCHPASRQRDATAEAADPVPIAIKSNFLVIILSRHFTFDSQMTMEVHQRTRPRAHMRNTPTTTARREGSRGEQTSGIGSAKPAASESPSRTTALSSSSQTQGFVLRATVATLEDEDRKG